MIEQMQIEEYIFDFCENKVQIKMKLSRNHFCLVIEGFIIVIFAILFVFAAIICFLSAGYFYAILFFLMSVSMVCSFLFRVWQGRKRREKFCFVIDERGVTHTDLDKIYQIPWASVISWGFVNHNFISGVRPGANTPRQICMYFAQGVYKEKYLRRKFDRIESNFRAHASTSEMIVLGLRQDNLPKEIYEKLVCFVQMHSGESKHLDYFCES